MSTTTPLAPIRLGAPVNPALWTLVGVVITSLAGLVIALLNRRASPYGELAKRVVALEERNVRQSARIDALERKERRHAEVLRHHAAWDAKVLAALAPEIAQSLGVMPPLYPTDED